MTQKCDICQLNYKYQGCAKTAMVNISDKKPKQQQQANNNLTTNIH